MGTSPAPATTAVATPPSPLLRFVAEENVGAQTIVTDDRGAILYVAVIEGDYNAASGRRCKRVTLDRPGGGATQRMHRVACFERSAWRFTEPLLDDGGPASTMLN